MPNTELSPKSMAEAAYTAAVAQIEQQDRNKRSHDEIELDRATESTHRGDGDGTISNPKKLFTGDSLSHSGHGEDSGRENDVGTRIKEIWKNWGDKADSNKLESALSETLNLLAGEVDSFLQLGLSAFYDLDTTTRQLAQSKELAEARSREAQRLQSIDEQSRASLQNLLRAVESSKAEARDSSRSAQVEARLRTEINSLRDERDKAQTELSDSRRKLSLLEEELRLTKSKLSRTMSEKISMERDSRAAISLARSLDNNNTNDMSYYKRKVGELSDKLQAQQDLISKLRGRKSY